MDRERKMEENSNQKGGETGREEERAVTEWRGAATPGMLRTEMERDENRE